MKIASLSFVCLMLVCCQTRQADRASAPPKATPEQMSEQNKDESATRLYFELTSPESPAECTRGSFANGLATSLDAIYCLADASFKVGESVDADIQNTSVRCPNEHGLVAIDIDSNGALRGAQCRRIEMVLENTTEYTLQAGSMESLSCHRGSYLKGLSFADGNFKLESILCVGSRSSSENALGLTQTDPFPNVDMETLDTVQIRSKFFSMTSDYSLLSNSVQIAKAVGSFFSAGLKYSLVNLHKEVLLQSHRDWLLPYYTFLIPKQSPLRLSDLKDSTVTEAKRLIMPLEFHVGAFLYFEDPKGQKLGYIDQRNFTWFGVQFDVKDMSGKPLFFIEQKFHLFRYVFDVKKLANGPVTMKEAILATIVVNQFLRSSSNN